MVKVLQDKFAHLGLTYSIGGQISFDVFPKVLLFTSLQDSNFQLCAFLCAVLVAICIFLNGRDHIC